MLIREINKILGCDCVSDRKRLNQTNLFQASPERLAGGWLVWRAYIF